MLYICYGMPKSGSTLAYELTAGLLAACGFPQDKLASPLMEAKQKVNFVSFQRGWGEGTLKSLQPLIDDSAIIAVKTHAVPSDCLLRIEQPAPILVQTVHRDPRDNVLSLMDAGTRCQRRGKGSFLDVVNIRTAISRYKKDFAVHTLWQQYPGALSVGYDEVAFDSISFLHRLAAQLKLDVQNVDLEKLVQQVKGSRFTQLNKGIQSRHQQELTPEQNLALAAVFRGEFRTMPDTCPLPEELLTASSAMSSKHIEEYLDTIDTLYHRKAHPMPKTQKTYVVLGCPRGGTSLIAGALKTAGVYMGDYRTPQYEDPEFKVPIADAARAVNILAPVIKRRNMKYENWGWKFPNSIYYIRNIQQLLINPVYIFVYRDPISIAKSSCKHDNRNWEDEKIQLIKVAKGHTGKVREFQESLLDETALQVFTVENIQQNPEVFARDLLALLQQDEALLPDLLSFINPQGGYNLQDFKPRKPANRAGLLGRLKRLVRL